MTPLVITRDFRAACPRCFPGDTPAVTPSPEPVPDGNGSLRASYACLSCGHTWTCWWDADAAGWLTAGPRPLAELIAGLQGGEAA